MRSLAVFVVALTLGVAYGAGVLIVRALVVWLETSPIG